MNKQIFMDLLEKKEFKAVRSILEVMNTVDIAALLADLEDKELIQAFRLIEKSKAADVFAQMSSSMQVYLVEMFTEKELQELLNDLYMDDTVDLLEELPANLVTRILDHVSKEKRDQINTILNYPEDSAGSIMTTEYVDLKKTTTVKEAMAHIKETGIRKETIYTCYILENRRLIGIVSAKDLMTMDDDLQMEELMETEIISVTTHTDQEETARLFAKYDLLALPVLDMQGYMVGIVTIDDALDVIVDETTEDMEIMNALNPSEKTYFETSVAVHAKNRIGWLLVLMLSATITQTIIARYEAAFAALPLLVSFIPMLTDTGGNCGSQSSTLVIRGLALDEIHFQDIFRVVFKEFRVALLVGVVLAVTNGIYIMVRYHDPMMAVLIAISLTATIIMAKIIGCILPLFAKKLHVDPAIMAAPLITTIVDAGSILIYFQVATHLLGMV
ncbi:MULTISPECIES: magnesium transporter [Sellimonas]|uniref:Magnesium transporter MgtE n=1 Tax=Sellimonas caecigallum TaxID=2592333 RepID=A0ABS7L5N7_9FIRM|nr:MULTISPECIES: magnesium transporter [Sellimonas]MBY0758292.1 magnesium transporter [Sellimonas caecigallum]OUP62432.1 magnesium transporter [Drancourtella sp. An177]